MPRPELSVIVVNWNTKRLLRECLSSLYRETAGIRIEAIVVDNDSSDGSQEMVEKEFPCAVLLKNDENAGFARANNQAASSACGRYLLFLNSDAVVLPGTVGRMVRFMRNTPCAVGCSPALRMPTGRLQAAAFGCSLSLVRLINYFFFLSVFFPRFFSGVWQKQGFFVQKGEPVRAGWLFGTCLMVRRAVFEEVGGFDESYHMYSEDIDIGERLRRFGDLYFLPDVEIIHHVGASSAGVQVGWLASLFRYIRASHGLPYLLACHAAAACGFGIRWVIYRTAGLLRPGYREKAEAMYKYFGYCVMSVPGEWDKEAV